MSLHSLFKDFYGETRVVKHITNSIIMHFQQMLDVAFCTIK